MEHDQSRRTYAPIQGDKADWKRLAQECAQGAIYDSNERLPYPTCHRGTRVSLLQDLKTIVDGTGRKIVWIAGGSGTGKSAVAHAFADQLRDEGRLAATFFFSRDHPKRCTFDHVFLTIAYQLGLRHPHAQNRIMQAIADDPALFSPEKSPRDLLEKLVIQTLRALPAPSRLKDDMTMILDAVDEGASKGSGHIKPFIDLLVRLIRTITTPIHTIIITGRPLPRIIAAMKRREIQDISKIVKLDSYDSYEDVRRLFQDEFDQIYFTHDLSLLCQKPWPSQHDFSILLKQSKGRILFAVTILAFIDEDQPHLRLRYICHILGSNDRVDIDYLHDVIKSGKLNPATITASGDHRSTHDGTGARADSRIASITENMTFSFPNMPSHHLPHAASISTSNMPKVSLETEGGRHGFESSHVSSYMSYLEDTTDASMSASVPASTAPSFPPSSSQPSFSEVFPDIDTDAIDPFSEPLLLPELLSSELWNLLELPGDNANQEWTSNIYASLGVSSAPSAFEALPPASSHTSSFLRSLPSLAPQQQQQQLSGPPPSQASGSLLHDTQPSLSNFPYFPYSTTSGTSIPARSALLQQPQNLHSSHSRTRNTSGNNFSHLSQALMGTNQQHSPALQVPRYFDTSSVSHSAATYGQASYFPYSETYQELSSSRHHHQPPPPL